MSVRASPGAAHSEVDKARGSSPHRLSSRGPEVRCHFVLGPRRSSRRVHAAESLSRRFTARPRRSRLGPCRKRSRLRLRPRKPPALAPLGLCGPDVARPPPMPLPSAAATPSRQRILGRLSRRTPRAASTWRRGPPPESASSTRPPLRSRVDPSPPLVLRSPTPRRALRGPPPPSPPYAPPTTLQTSPLPLP